MFFSVPGAPSPSDPSFRYEKCVDITSPEVGDIELHVEPCGVGSVLFTV